ncbi:hypothetical protein WJX84_010662 [Apatococcus fuscideae]|uniref:DUF1350 domain-containing protein n=1 Tax=Apatococcus fuscideae TaxID=2026836 RepID=A0AAW1SWS1_9CHLO
MPGQAFSGTGRPQPLALGGLSTSQRRTQIVNNRPEEPANPVQVPFYHFSPPESIRPRGIVHFLGGAFAGATPQLLYPGLIRQLSKAGYAVISTPYAVTFRHLDCAQRVQEGLETALAELRGDRLRRWAVPQGLPLHGVGHSNGALLHLLIGCQLATPNQSNVIISFNNKEVKDAIPVPLDGLQAAVSTIPQTAFSQPAVTAFDFLRSAGDVLATVGVPVDKQQLLAVAPGLDQIGSVFEEVRNGNLEFTPPPEQSRAMIASRYRTPRTLLVRFMDDPVDETNVIYPILSGRGNRQGCEELVLPGSHATPCFGGDLPQVGRSFSPLDAILQGVNAFTQMDLNRCCDRVISWLDSTS